MTMGKIIKLKIKPFTPLDSGEECKVVKFRFKNRKTTNLYT